MIRVIDWTSSRLGTVGAVVRLLYRRKLWWLVPMFCVLLLFIVLLALATTTGIAPFIYTLF